MKSKNDYISEFKKNNEAKYSNKFASEPTTRPSYIPATTTTSTGVSVPVVFNANLGGYGYYVGSNWVMYDPLDVLAISAFNSYASSYRPAPVIYHDSAGSFAAVMSFVVFAVILIILFNLIRSRV